MDELRREDLEAKLKEALRAHQHDGLHMIGGADQLVAKLVRVVEEWEHETPQQRQKSA